MSWLMDYSRSKAKTVSISLFIKFVFIFSHNVSVSVTKLQQCLLFFEEVESFGPLSGELGEGTALPHAAGRVVLHVRRGSLYCTAGG